MYGARFDMIFVINVLIELNVKFECLPVGTGVFMLKIPSFNQVYLDACKFFQQPLAKLPKRFGLPDDKGLFSYAYNKMENWGLVRKQPPDIVIMSTLTNIMRKPRQPKNTGTKILN